jgi:hypothetical protein
MPTKKPPEPQWYRRVVPPGYERATLLLAGTSPLLMNSGEADRDSAEYRAYYMLGQKKKKSLDDEARLRELDWALGMYLDEKLGPYIPGKNVKEMLRSSATKWRKGEEIKRSLVVIEYRIPLLYDGPRTQQELWDGEYRYTVMVANAGAGSGRVLRCRPKFEQWSLAAELAYDPEDLDFDFLTLVAERAKKYGLGDYRPEFGSFDPQLERGDVRKVSANGSAIKKVVREHLLAHLAMVDRIMVEAA